jgi:hypothetical protein
MEPLSNADAPPFVVVHVDRHGRAVAQCLHCREREMMVAPTRALFDLKVAEFGIYHRLCPHTATCACRPAGAPAAQLSLLGAS